MKKVILLSIILIFLITGIGFAFQNEPDGFRGLKWGDAPTEDMVRFVNTDLLKDYNKPNGKLGIGDAKFYRLEYWFYKNRFFSVSGLFENEDNYDILKIICEEKFGEPIKEKYYCLDWFGEKTGIRLEYNIIKRKGTLKIYNSLILSEWNEENKQKEIEKAKEDF